MESNKVIRVVSRSSPLSLLQVGEVFSFLPHVSYNLVSMESFGDKHKEISLMDNIAGDFFTRELDAVLQNNEADIAVHSAKDLPYPLPADLELYALTEAVDKTDSLVSRGNLTLSQLPPNARVGTSSAARKAELLKLRPDLAIVAIRGTIEERIAQVDNNDIDALIVATCALIRLNLSHRIAEALPFKTHALQGNLAVVGRKGNAKLKAVFSGFDIRKKYGKVTLAGFGPGNPDLLTIGADKALSKADIIFHDDLIDIRFLDKYAAQKVYVGKRKGKHSHHQDEINELVYRAALSGNNTVRLKGGDPMIFAHGREEIDFLKSRFVEVEVIPGISAGTALAAYTHIPLTHRGVSSSVAFITGHSGKCIQTPCADTLVYYMGGENMSRIAGELIRNGKSAGAPAALVYNVSLPGQKVFYTSLEELQYSVMKYPAPLLIVAGETVALESREANRQKVLVTGTVSTDYGGLGNIIHTPLIKIEKMQRNSAWDALLPEIGAYDWIIFTSRYGVRFFFEMLEESQFDIRLLAAVKTASVGKT
ncbi:MAG: uroporphyrinogen-III C-methyltransferase, partial [Treponema sp.]|nr:uroporphyrinogen-III C-methyltransferase [Treponema sp.]